MKESMLHNFKGRIKNFPTPKDPFTSLFEAISNSLQAIEEINLDKGEINIAIERQNEPLVEGGIYPIRNIFITDNGIGFNDKNMMSFRTFDSDYKSKIGGKGIGRLNWLKTFNNVEVLSVFNEGKENSMLRHFNFNLDDEIEIIDTEHNGFNLKTEVKLLGLKQEFYSRSAISTKQIANKLVEHFTSLLVMGITTKINIFDMGDEICINDYFVEDKYIQSKEEKLKINKQTYELKHVFLKTSPNENHQIFICAQKRVVNHFSIPNIEELPTSFDIENNKAIYQCFISGDFLDKDVNQERSGFNTLIFDKPNGNTLVDDQLNIYDQIVNAISIYLDKFIEPYKEEKMNYIRNYIQNDAPEYLHLYKKRLNELEKITYTNAKNKYKMRIELFKINQKMNLENFDAVNSIESIDEVSDDQINQIMENVTDIAKSELVSYVIRRKLIIDLLRKMLSYENADQYFKENRLHKLFFPMKSDDLNIDYEKHNLWLIDERLAYSYRFFSDEPIKKIFIDSKDTQRPDGLFLDTISFSDSLNGTASNVTIVEFKRPGRDDYSDKDNPFSQIYQYIDAIKGKTAKGVNGDIINVDDNTKFVAYVIADLTETLKNQMRRQNLKPSSNHDTYFSYNEGYQVFFEVIPYNVILDNSVKRNDVFFKKISI